MGNIIKCKYQSVWDDCTVIESDATIDSKTGRIEIEDTDEDYYDMEMLTAERLIVNSANLDTDEEVFYFEFEGDFIDTELLESINTYYNN